MSDVLEEDSDSFQIYPVEIDSSDVVTKKFQHFTLDLTNTHHANVPAIAVRVNVGNKSILVSGDTNNENSSLQKLAKNVDLFVAHHAIAEFARGYATKLHMKPSMIAKIAKEGHVKRVLLSHRMKRTLGSEQRTLEIIKKEYEGEVKFAEDKMQIKIKD